VIYVRFANDFYWIDEAKEWKREDGEIATSCNTISPKHH
jgi:hypothetical protein